MGKKGTSVGNKYKEDILVTVQADSKKLHDIAAKVGFKGVNVAAKINIDHELVRKTGYTRIGPNMATMFYVDKKKVYISIVTVSGRVVCGAHPCKGNTPVVVNSDGFLVIPGASKVDDDTFVYPHGAKKDGDDVSAITVETSLPQDVDDWVVGDVEEFIRYCDGLEKASPYLEDDDDETD